jgi:ribose transport system substrate-binding protein
MVSSRTARAAIIAASITALGAIGVVAPVGAQDAGTGDGRAITVISPFYSSQPASKEAIDLFIAEADARGYETRLVDTNNDNAAVNGELTTAAAQGTDAIVTAFTFSQELGEGLASAGEAGVPVFGLDAGGVVEPMLVNVTTDPGFLGEASAQAIVDALGGPGRIAEIHFDPFEPVRLRAEAARALFAANDVEIIESIEGSPEDATGFARTTVLDLLTKYPEGELDAIWAGWDASALGAYQATQETGRTEVLVTGVDGQDFARAEVAKGGNWIATVRQDWPAVAVALADIVDAHFAGTDPAEPTVFVPGEVLTAENAQ